MFAMSGDAAGFDASAAAKRGYDLSALRARTIEDADFQRFDLILAMDQEHYATLSRSAGAAAGHKLKLMMSYARRFKERKCRTPTTAGLRGSSACSICSRTRRRACSSPCEGTEPALRPQIFGAGGSPPVST